MRHLCGHPAIVEIYDSDIVYDAYGGFSEVYIYVSPSLSISRFFRVSLIWLWVWVWVGLGGVMCYDVGSYYS